MINMSIEQWWHDTNKGKSNYSEKNLFFCRFTHHKSHIDCRGVEPRPPRKDLPAIVKRTFKLPVCPFWRREKCSNPNSIKQWALSVHHQRKLSGRNFSVLNKIWLYNFVLFFFCGWWCLKDPRVWYLNHDRVPGFHRISLSRDFFTTARLCIRNIFVSANRRR